MKLEDKLIIFAEARACGCSEVTIDGIKYGLGPEVKQVAPPMTDEEAKDLVKNISVFDEMTEDEILYYATPWFDELQEQKKLHAEHLKNEALKNG